VAHLASVIVAFAITPYTKFVHWIYRLLAMYKDNLDQAVQSVTVDNH
jgi:citrate/tricarballylate utilization protein